MKPDLAYQPFKRLMWYAVVFSVPFLLATSLADVLASAPSLGVPVQAMPHALNPALITAVAALLALGPWMLRRWVNTPSTRIKPTPQSF